ncbi:MAG: hypothetical protein AB1498_02545 [bacterium]
MYRITKLLLALIFTATLAECARADETIKRVVLPKQVDLRERLTQWQLKPRSQGGRKTCSVFAAAGALEFAVSRYFQRGVTLSIEYLNWACNQVIGNQTEDRGQFFYDLIRGYERYGICFDADMPYQDHFNPNLRPSEQAMGRAREVRTIGLKVYWINSWKAQKGLTDEQLWGIKIVLAEGYPVAVGSTHSNLIVGYSDDLQQPGGGIFLVKDSAIAAYDTITYEFVKQEVGDVLWIEAQEKLVSK